MATVSLGVDLAGTGPRAVFSIPGKAAEPVALPAARWPWLLCEPASASLLPVTFPTLKSRLGTALREGTADPAETFARALDSLRDLVTAQTSMAVGQTVISVPARFTSGQRAALLKAASQTALGQVRLITDSVAAVIGHASGEAGTYLVVDMGYSGYEIGLVRAERGCYRSLGYEGTKAPGGATFDELVLGGWLQTLRSNNAQPEEYRHDDWRQLREGAELVKEGLSSEAQVLFPVPMADTDGTPRFVAFERRNFEAAVRARVVPVLDRVDRLLARADMRRKDIDQVVLTGGSTRIPEVRRLFSGLGTTVVPDVPEPIARGAARYAALTSDRPTINDYAEASAANGHEADPPVNAPPLEVTLLTAPGSEPPGRRAGLDRARQLVENGMLDEAAHMLRDIVADAQELLNQISSRTVLRRQPISAGQPGDDPPPTATDEGQQLLAQARQLFDQGDFANAITTAHLAWDRKPDMTDVFEGMIDLHCRAAMAAPTPEGFVADEQWLRCALRHDPSSSRIRGLLAERIFLHSAELSRHGQTRDARRALEAALKWDPNHQAAMTLLRRLNRSRNPKKLPLSQTLAALPAKRLCLGARQFCVAP